MKERVVNDGLSSRTSRLVVGSASLDRALAYGLLRFTLGINMLLHGAVRLPALDEFAEEMVKLFGGTPVPEAIVRPFALILPFLEAGIGLLVLAGLWTRGALITGALLMAALVFGTALRSDWNALAIQMLYAAIYAALLATRQYNVFSVDALLRRCPSGGQLRPLRLREVAGLIRTTLAERWARSKPQISKRSMR